MPAALDPPPTQATTKLGSRPIWRVDCSIVSRPMTD